MTDSILDTIKLMLLITTEDEAFNQQLIVYINSAFMTLYQLGVGPDKPFVLTGKETTWSEFLEDGDADYFQAVKLYVFMKTKILFDPPGTSFVLDAMNNEIANYEWRLTNIADERRNKDAV